MGMETAIAIIVLLVLILVAVGQPWLAILLAFGGALAIAGAPPSSPKPKKEWGDVPVPEAGGYPGWDFWKAQIPADVRSRGNRTKNKGSERSTGSRGTPEEASRDQKEDREGLRKGRKGRGRLITSLPSRKDQPRWCDLCPVSPARSSEEPRAEPSDPSAPSLTP